MPQNGAQQASPYPSTGSREAWFLRLQFETLVDQGKPPAWEELLIGAPPPVAEVDDGTG
jgi:hypothetical protein